MLQELRGQKSCGYLTVARILCIHRSCDLEDFLSPSRGTRTLTAAPYSGSSRSRDAYLRQEEELIKKYANRWIAFCAEVGVVFECDSRDECYNKTVQAVEAQKDTSWFANAQLKECYFDLEHVRNLLVALFFFLQPEQVGVPLCILRSTRSLIDEYKPRVSRGSPFIKLPSVKNEFCLLG